MIFISQLIGREVTNPFFTYEQAVRAPGVVWEMGSKGGLSPVEAGALVDDLAACGSPFIMFVVQDETLREDLFELVKRARRQSLGAVLVFTRVPAVAGVGRMLADAGTSLVLIDVDAPRAAHFLAECRAGGVPVGVRQILIDVDSVNRALSLARETGSGVSLFHHPMISQKTDGQQTREIMSEVYEAASQSDIMIASEGNRADAVYMYLRLRQDDPRPARDLRTAIFRPETAGLYADMAYVDDDGAVFPEEHWRWGTVGNVREKPFSRIWTDPGQPLLRGFRMRRLLVQGRCKLCGYLEVCNGNQRARAKATGDPWAEDPGCYLTNDEIKPNS